MVVKQLVLTILTIPVGIIKAKYREQDQESDVRCGMSKNPTNMISQVNPTISVEIQQVMMVEFGVTPKTLILDGSTAPKFKVKSQYAETLN